MWQAGATLHCGKRGLLFIVACGLLIAVASLVGSTGSRCVGFSSCGVWASVVVARGLSSCGSWALARRLSSYGARA